MSIEKIRTILRLLDEISGAISADTYWLTRDEQDMFERLVSELKQKLRYAYSRKGAENV